jgi:hypothetical protein
MGALFEPGLGQGLLKPSGSRIEVRKAAVWATPILGMIFLDIFPWAKERLGETTSKRIERERRFFDIMNFFFQCLKDNAQLITLSIGNFSSRMIHARIAKKYHLFTHLSILINRM